MKIGTKHVHGSGPEIRCVKQSIAGGIGGDREAFVDSAGRVVNGDDGIIEIHVRRPAGNGAVLRGEKKSSGSRFSVFRHHEPGAAVENGPGGCPARRIAAVRRGNVNTLRWICRKRYLHTLAGVQSGNSSPIIRNPKRAGGTVGETPRVEQIWIKRSRHTLNIGDQIGLQIGANGQKTPIFQILQRQTNTAWLPNRRRPGKNLAQIGK